MKPSGSEEWRPVVGWEGCYEVSSAGRVRTVERDVVMSNGRARRVRGRVRSQQALPNGYLTVTLKTTDRKQWAYVHRLVACAFLGGAPDNAEVCHYDGDRQNNVVSNLRWDTRRANLSDRGRHGTETRGSRNGQAKLSPSDVRAIRQEVRAGRSQREVARCYGVSESQVGRIVRGLRWAWLS